MKPESIRSLFFVLRVAAAIGIVLILQHEPILTRGNFFVEMVAALLCGLSPFGFKVGAFAAVVIAFITGFNSGSFLEILAAGVLSAGINSAWLLEMQKEFMVVAELRERGERDYKEQKERERK